MTKLAAMSAILGVSFLAAGLHGYLTRHLGPIERAMLVAAAMTLIDQGLLTDTVGIALGFSAWLLSRRNPPGCAALHPETPPANTENR